MDGVEERRRVSRRRFVAEAVLRQEAPLVTQSCVIVELSTEGARLRGVRPDVRPGRLELNARILGGAVGCDLVWRDGDTVGVRFIEAISIKPAGLPGLLDPARGGATPSRRRRAG